MKEPVKGSRKYLHPSSVGMTPTSWTTKKEAKIAELELEKRVQEMYSQTTATILDLVSICNKYMKSLPKTMNSNTVKAKKHFCEEILKRWGNIAVIDLKVYQVQEYLEEREREVSSNSFNVYRKHGSIMINWAKKQQLLPHDTLNVFEAVKRKPHQQKKKGPAPVEDVLKVLAAANTDQADILWFLIHTGARKSEILTMEWSDVDLEHKTYLLRTKKSGTGLEKVTKHNMSKSLYELFKKRYEMRHPELDYVLWHKFYSSKAGCRIDGRFQTIG
ncbi:MAG: tyrosine-type recombinase/integrase [Desulfobulbaceae bacterium]|nr:tyrosine-type recombinase/integrase [Desulfobulbaceae bacterium]